MRSINPGCFCLCLGDFVDCSCPNVDNSSKCRNEWIKENDPPKGKKKCLTLGDIGNSSRFQFVFKKDAETAQQKYVPANTEKSTHWATKVFADWKQARQLAGEGCCSDDLLERADPSHLPKWLSLFAVEARQASGDFYSPEPRFLRIDTIRYGTVQYSMVRNDTIRFNHNPNSNAIWAY